MNSIIKYLTPLFVIPYSLSTYAIEFLPIKNIKDIEILASDAQSKEIDVHLLDTTSRYKEAEPHRNPIICAAHKKDIAKAILKDYKDNTTNKIDRTKIDLEINRSLIALEKIFTDMMSGDKVDSQGKAVQWKENYYQEQSFLSFITFSRSQVEARYPHLKELTLSTMPLSDLGEKYGRKLAEFNLCLNRVAQYKDYKDFYYKHGWPTLTEYGKQAQNHFFLVMQHFQHDISFLEEVARSMDSLVPSGEVTPILYTDLADKIAILKNQKQPYGTFMSCEGNKAAFYKGVVDEVNLDKRRSKYGLEPYKDSLAERSKLCEKIYRGVSKSDKL